MTPRPSWSNSEAARPTMPLPPPRLPRRPRAPGSPERRFALFVFGAVLLSYGWFGYYWDKIPNPNETTRLYLTLAVVDDGTLAINDAMKRHGIVWDRAERAGQFYCDKAPGMSFLAVPGYALAKWTAGLLGYELTYEGTHAVVRWTAVILPTALFCWALFLFLAPILPDPRLRLLLVLVYALGSQARIYGVLLFGHQTAAVLSAGGLMLLWRCARAPGVLATLGLFAAGLLVGGAFAVEYPTFVAAVAAGVLALLVVRPWWRIPLVGVAVAIPVALCLWYNEIAFGNPFSPGYAHLDTSFAAVHAKGLFGVTTPKLEAFYGALFSPERGLFFLQPWLLAALPGLYWLIRRRELRALGVACTVAFAGYVYFISSFGYWIGGDSAGSRHLTPLIPLLIPAVAIAMERASRARLTAGRALLSGTFVYSLAMLALVASTFSYFEPKLENPYRDITLEMWREGAFPESVGTWLYLSGFAGVLPSLLPTAFALLTACVGWPGILDPARGLAAIVARAGVALYPLAFGALALAAVFTLRPATRVYDTGHEAYRYLKNMPTKSPRFGRPDDDSRESLVGRGNLAAAEAEHGKALELYHRAAGLR